MTAQKILNYMKTEKGKHLTFQSVCFAGVAMFSASYLPNTVFIDKFKDIVQAYRGGVERKMPDKLQRRFDIAMEVCQCSNFEQKFLKPFVVYGFDTMQIGSTKSRFGGLIGVPTNYFYDTYNDVEKQDITIRNESIKWSSEDGKRLQNALVLTEDEQIFGMARSILQVKTHKLLITSLYAPVTLFTVYTLGTIINLKRNLFALPLGVRAIMYSILGLFGYGMYSFSTDFTQVYYDTEVDKQLCEVGPEFMEAGVRFYDKLLQKNIAIRNLIGDTRYTALGNEAFLLRQKSLPLTIRKSYFEMRLDELKTLVNEQEKQ